jgi:hypothetical protein
VARRIWEPILQHKPHPRILPPKDTLELLFERIPRSRNSNFPEDVDEALQHFAQSIGCLDGKSMITLRLSSIAELGTEDVFQTQNSLRTAILLLSRLTSEPVQDHFDG